MISPTTPATPQAHAGRAAAAGVALSAAVIAVSLLLSDALALELHAILLAIIGAIYVGFALGEGGAQRAVELAAAAGFGVFALLGLALSPWWIAAGLALHAGWDALHHRGWPGRPLRTRVPAWYVPFCAVVDLALAGFVVVLNLA